MRMLMGGTVAALLVVVLAVFALSGGSEVSFANAANRMQGKDLRSNMTMVMSVEGTELTMKGTLLQSADLKRYRMDLEGEVAGTDVSQTLVVVGKDLWLTSPSFEAVLPEGKTWVHGGDDAMPDIGSMSFEELMAFCEAATDIEERGTAEIDGVRVTHYTGTIDFEAAAKTLGQDAKAFGGENAQAPIELWLDDTGNAVRMKMDVAVEGETASITMDGFEYDVDVSSIKAPPADAVVSDEEVGIFSEG